MQDFFDELGVVALGSRLKRLSDKLSADAANVFKHFGEKQHPRWFTLFSLLGKHGAVGVVEASQRLGLTQPAISQFSKEMQEAGLVAITRDREDSRKRVLSLTELGKQQLEQMQYMCELVEKSANQLSLEGGNDFYSALVRFEKALNRQSLLSRAIAFEEQAHD